MKKKITVVLLIILILFNFIYCKAVFAEPTTTTGIDALTPKDNNGNPIDLSNTFKGIGDDIAAGMTSVENSKDPNKSSKNFDSKERVKNAYGSTGGVITSFLGFVLVEWLNNIPERVVEATGSTVIEDKFTIYDLVMGNYEFFNLNFYKMDEMKNLSNDGLMSAIVSKVFSFYKTMRYLAMALSLFVLLYIAIRMVISTSAGKQARYKNMLIAWFTSFVLIVFMHYIIIIISYVTQFALDIVKDLAEVLGVTNIERDILKGQIDTLQNGKKGFHLIQSLLLISGFVYFEIKFLIAYIKRYCEMTFLITISPLVTVTYAMDKVGDNKAQAFSAWFKELSTKYAIQVVHALTYVLLISAAGEIAQVAPIVAIFFLWSMDRAERVARNVVGLQGEKIYEKAKPPKAPGLPRFLSGRPHSA